ERSGALGIKGDRAIWEAESRGIELIDITIGELFDRQCEAHPDKEALVYSYPEIGLDLRLSYRQYKEEVDRLAKGLLALGIEKGEHVAVWATNVPEWVFLEIALAKIGAVLVTVNTNCRASEIEYVLRQGDITTLFMIEELRGNSYIESLYQIAPELTSLVDPLHARLQSAALPELKRVILIENKSQPGMMLYSQVLPFGDGISDGALIERQSSLDPHDVIQMQYTSGTTGFPKGVMLTHYGIINQAHVSCLIGNLKSDERYVTAMPLFHIAGSLGAVMFSVYLGCTLIPLISFDPAKELELFAREKATFSFNVPTMLVAMLNQPRFIAGEFDLSSLREIITGATPVPVVLMEDVRAKMGADCTIVFGLTESTGTVTETVQSDSFELKSSTVGIPHPHMDIKIADPLTGVPVGFGESGELMARGFLVMKGYYNMPDRTAEAIDAEGWLHTGDLATMNSQGYVNIVGRVKDMIIRGGENIYPAEIEAFLMRHPDIAEAQVVGLPDSFMGEEVAAVLRLKAGSVADDDNIRQYCLDGISRHKVPKYIRFTTAFPLTSSGKVKKFELKQQLIKELGLKEVAKLRTA
ncbi:MAG TPA: AMP-binding protein, partial [Blastocatellia bacterium]|nr:AMP-binding protein [Blastocatellia bacterium]